MGEREQGREGAREGRREDRTGGREGGREGGKPEIKKTPLPEKKNLLNHDIKLNYYFESSTL